jgi:hypothetical protein
LGGVGRLLLQISDILSVAPSGPESIGQFVCPPRCNDVKEAAPRYRHVTLLKHRSNRMTQLGSQTTPKSEISASHEWK